MCRSRPVTCTCAACLAALYVLCWVCCILLQCACMLNHTKVIVMLGVSQGSAAPMLFTGQKQWSSFSSCLAKLSIACIHGKYKSPLCKQETVQSYSKRLRTCFVLCFTKLPNTEQLNTFSILHEHHTGIVGSTYNVPFSQVPPYQPASQKHFFLGKLVPWMLVHEPWLLQSLSFAHTSVSIHVGILQWLLLHHTIHIIVDAW